MEIRKFLENLSPVEIKQHNEEQLKETLKEYKEFLTAFNKKCCYLCGMKLSYFSRSEPCFHWFLIPTGIRKKDFNEYLSTPIEFFHFESYLRWVANTEAKIKNINDLKNPNEKIIERTIKYKNIEWTLNVGSTDLNGHENSKNANFPHFHIQIHIDGRPFIKFNNFHIPFSRHDLFMFEVIKNDDLVDHLNLFGEGISVIDNETDLKWIDEHLKSTDFIEDATFHTRSFFEMPYGETITLNKFDEYRIEASKKKLPIRKYLQKEIPGIKIISEIRPGGGVVDKKNRNKRKNSGNIN